MFYLPGPEIPKLPDENVEDADVEMALSNRESDTEEAPRIAGAPKVIGHSEIDNRVDKVRVLNVFYKYLLSMDGGSRPQEHQNKT